MSDNIEKQYHIFWTNFFKALGPIKPYFLGAFSGICSTCLIQPIDIVKTRIIKASEQRARGIMTNTTNPVKIVKKLWRKNGIISLYTGLQAGIMREIFYASIKMGWYQVLMDQYSAKHGGKKPGLLEKSIYSMASGGLGAAVSNPADKIMVEF